MNAANTKKRVLDVLLIAAGSALYALGFDIFLRPYDITGGGLSGLAMIVAELTGFNAVGTMSLIANIPLFLIGWKRLGRFFFLGSLLGMVVVSVGIDVMVFLPAVQTEPLLAGVFGGVITGFGLGLVFLRGASTGGIDILARLVRQRSRRFPIGKIMLAIDCVIVILNGIVFEDVNKALYSAVALYIMSVVMDGVIYGRNDSGVFLIISEKYREIADEIDRQLDRGATLLPATGAYTNQPKTVILCAVKEAQVGQLQRLVTELDPEAFLIVQKAHQILGEGFGRYSDNSL